MLFINTRKYNGSCIIFSLKYSRYMRNFALFGNHTFLLFFMSFFTLRTTPLILPPLPLFYFILLLFYFFIPRQDRLPGLNCQRASPSGLASLPRTLYLLSSQLWTRAHWNVFRPRWGKGEGRWSVLANLSSPYAHFYWGTIYSISPWNKRNVCFISGQSTTHRVNIILLLTYWC